MEELERKKQVLLEKYKQGSCTPEELALLHYIYNFSAASAVEDETKDEEKVKAEIWAKLPAHQTGNANRHHTVKLRIWSAVAAVLLITGIGITYLKLDNFNKPAPGLHEAKIAPGTSGATLTLSNGKKIKLSEATNGELAREAGVRVLKMEDGTLVYELQEKGAGLNQANVLSTSKGETYKVKLPDGTMVWLNAASSITYPSSFSRLKHRLVELSGEAYFEVSKDRAHPFIVKTARQDVEVLGTHFNVNAYPDENLVKTTLLEGSVKVSAQGRSQLIRPGEQLVLSEKNELSISAIEPGMAIAWKNGEFVFDDESIEQVMNTIARWYNIDVVYSGAKPAERFGGSISRFDDVAKVLKMLQRTGAIHFDIKDRTIYVSK